MRFFLPNSFSRGRDVNWLVWVSSSATSSSKLSRKSGLFEKNKIKRTKKNKSRERHEGKKGKGEGEDGRKVVLECCDFENLTDQTHQLTTAEKRSLQQKMLCSGDGGGQVVSVLTFYSDDSRSYPAEACSFYLYNLFLKRRK